MKIIIIALCFFLSAMAVYPRAIREEAVLSDEKTRISYAFGMMVGEDLKDAGFEIDYFAFAEGMRASMEDLETKLDRDQAMETVQSAYEIIMARQAAEMQTRELEFLLENAARPGISVTESGLQYEIIEQGSGPKPDAGDTVRVHYEGSLINGTVFDSSYMRGMPEEIPLYMVIQGWSEGLQLMSVGGRYRLFIPSSLAYGEFGAGQIIPPYSTLIFMVELLEILKDEVEEE